MANLVPLDREEYIEQAYFFRVYRERLADNIPSQTILATIHEELLSTTKLPMAIEFLRGEIVHQGKISEGMTRLSHYFTPFQAFVTSRAEEDTAKFSIRTALEVLQREAEYRAETPSPQGLFVYQFEALSRNRLGYDRGMEAMSFDTLYDETWRNWIRKSRFQLGSVEFAEIVYRQSEYYVQERRRTTRDAAYQPTHPILFGLREGRIAWANRGKDPLYLFAALQRQLNYPVVPYYRPPAGLEKDLPELKLRIAQLEKRLQILESEVKGNFDISQFYVKPTTDIADEKNLDRPPQA